MKLDRIAYRLWRYNPAGLRRLYQHHRFDRRFGVHTRGYRDLRYEPTPAPVLEKALVLVDTLDIDLARFLFIDIGSGKGKVLLLAAAYPFKRVIGVELWEDLHHVAVSNLEALPENERRCGAIEPVCIDAARFPIPPEPTIFYFFNPFSESVLATVLENIETSLARHAQPVFIIFYAPILLRGAPWDRRRLFDASPLLRIIHQEKDFTIYAANV